MKPKQFSVYYYCRRYYKNEPFFFFQTLKYGNASNFFIFEKYLLICKMKIIFDFLMLTPPQPSLRSRDFENFKIMNKTHKPMHFYIHTNTHSQIRGTPLTQTESYTYSGSHPSYTNTLYTLFLKCKLAETQSRNALLTYTPTPEKVLSSHTLT